MVNNNNLFGTERKSQETGESQILIHESEGANPDSIKTILVENNKIDPIIEYRLKYPETKE